MDVGRSVLVAAATRRTSGEGHECDSVADSDIARAAVLLARHVCVWQEFSSLSVDHVHVDYAVHADNRALEDEHVKSPVQTL